jgi:hypothetical protein
MDLGQATRIVETVAARRRMPVDGAWLADVAASAAALDAPDIADAVIEYIAARVVERERNGR